MNTPKEFDMEKQQRELQKAIDAQNPAHGKQTSKDHHPGPYHQETPRK